MRKVSNFTIGLVCPRVLRTRALRAIAAAACFASFAAAQQGYVVTDLGTLGGTMAYPTSINNAGQVAGNSYLDAANTEARGFRTGPNKPIDPATDVVPTLGGTYSYAGGINNLGQVAGTATDGASLNYAIRYDADGTLNSLGSYGIVQFSAGNAINDSGQVTGAADYSFASCNFAGSEPAFRTAPNSPIVLADNLGTLLGGCRNSVGFGINSAGQVVGYSAAVSSINPEQHAMLATPSQSMVDLGILGGIASPPGFGAAAGHNATAVAINSLGQIVGYSTYNSAPFYYDEHAFLTTTAAGGLTDLGTLGGDYSEALGINASGMIVGNANLSLNTTAHAFLSNNGGPLQDLNNMIGSGSPWELVNAVAINDNGQIVATGWLNGVQYVGHAVRLDPANVAVTILTNLLSDPALGLTGGEISSLTDKLNNALTSIQGGVNKQAINQLNAFLSSVQSSAKTGKISAPAAGTLTAAAQAIIATL